MADNNTIARPYAQAAFELARDSGALAEWSAALAAAKAAMSDGAVAKYLSTPSLSASKRLEFLTGVLSAVDGESKVFGGADQRGSNFLKLLLEYGRAQVLPEIADHFETLKANVENSVDVTITSATEMSAAQQGEIIAALKARFGREINLATEIDESLIGGAVIRAGDVVIDGSLRSRLDGLANALVA
ncbi:MAG: F0F1 ATP synthase subunit delta [Sphingomonadales bacterium]|nr:F0F1 ATP synthase subunit delta [Sphingomonadales bacterium]